MTHLTVSVVFNSGFNPTGSIAASVYRNDWADSSHAPAGAKAESDELTWSGRIAHTIFRGPIRSIVVQTDDGRLNVDAPPFGNYPVGDNVTVVVSRRAAWAVVEPVPTAP